MPRAPPAISSNGRARAPADPVGNFCLPVCRLVDRDANAWSWTSGASAWCVIGSNSWSRARTLTSSARCAPAVTRPPNASPFSRGVPNRLRATRTLPLSAAWAACAAARRAPRRSVPVAGARSPAWRRGRAGGSSGLALRAPIRQPRIAALRPYRDRRAALSAWLTGATVDIQPLGGVRSSRRSPIPPIRDDGGGRIDDVRTKVDTSDRQDRAQRLVAQLADTREWIDPGEEQDFGLVDVTGAGDHALVQHRVADLCRAASAEAPQGLRFVERLAEQVGPHQAEIVLPIQPASRQKFRDRQVEPYGLEPRRGNHAPHVTARLAPAFAGTVDVPAAVHAHVRAQDEITGKVHQQMFAGGADPRDGAAGDRGIFVYAGEGGQRRFEAHDLVPRQRAMERARGAKDRVPFRHGASFESPSRR